MALSLDNFPYFDPKGPSLPGYNYSKAKGKKKLIFLAIFFPYKTYLLQYFVVVLHDVIEMTEQDF